MNFKIQYPYCTLHSSELKGGENPNNCAVVTVHIPLCSTFRLAPTSRRKKPMAGREGLQGGVEYLCQGYDKFL